MGQEQELVKVKALKFYNIEGAKEIGQEHEVSKDLADRLVFLGKAEIVKEKAEPVKAK